MTTSTTKLIIGTSCLGNLYHDIGYNNKKNIINEIIHCYSINSNGHNGLILDSAGKYGCGLGLEMLGMILKELKICPSTVRISNKLGWKRIPFDNDNARSCAKMEPGVWVNLDYDGKWNC